MIADLHCHYPMHVVMHEPRHRIEARLADRYGDDAERISSGNALRVLREVWRA